jgi:hypothetical protein
MKAAKVEEPARMRPMRAAPRDPIKGTTMQSPGLWFDFLIFDFQFRILEVFQCRVDFH